MKRNKQRHYERAAELLAQYRQASGFTQQDVATTLGKPQSFLSKIESGERKVDAIELIDLLNLYKRSLSDFEKAIKNVAQRDKKRIKA